MNQQKVIAQVSLGGYLEEHISWEKVRERLEFLMEEIPLEAVIVGWSCNRTVYEKMIPWLRERGTKSFLWLPLWSETGVMTGKVKKLVDDQGNEGKGYALTAGENFEFYCPNQRENIQSFFEIYEKKFDGLGFDGVFLDKIRYATCAGGLDGLFSCFCRECRSRYQEQGINVSELQEEMRKVRCGEAEYGSSVLGICGYENGKFRFFRSIWEQFFQMKQKAVTEGLRTVVNYFRDRKMMIGMDTLSPFLAGLVGQDLKELATLADFLKPMMYRMTQAPAGLPFETERLIRETARRSPEEARKKFLETLHCQEMGDQPWDLQFVERELSYLSGLDAPVFCGIEVNRNDICKASPLQIKETMEALKQLPLAGYVLSWDLLSATEDNLRAVMMQVKGR